MNNILRSDIDFVNKVLMPYFHIPVLKIGWNESKKKWPDIWCEKLSLPKITVTREWRRQDTHERRKRLTHEALHIAQNLEHGLQPNGLMYSTYPDKDTYSMFIYKNMMGLDHSENRNPSKPLYKIYIERIKNQWDWDGIVMNLKLREDARPGSDEYPVYFYLGNYLKVGPDITPDREGQHFYSKIWHFPPMMGGRMSMGGYRLGEWFSALVNIAKEHGLRVFVPTDEDPAELYVTLGKPPHKEYISHAVDEIEGF